MHLEDGPEEALKFEEGDKIVGFIEQAKSVMIGCDTLVSMAERVVDLVKQHAEAIQSTVKNIIRKFEGKLSEDIRIARVFVSKQAD